MSNQILVHCEHEVYCQGYEMTWGYFLVEAWNFEHACIILREKLDKAGHFKNCTILEKDQ